MLRLKSVANEISASRTPLVACRTSETFPKRFELNDLYRKGNQKKNFHSGARRREEKVLVDEANLSSRPPCLGEKKSNKKSFSPAFYIRTEEGISRKCLLVDCQSQPLFHNFSLNFSLWHELVTQSTSRHGFIFPLLLEHHLSRFFLWNAQKMKENGTNYGASILSREAKWCNWRRYLKVFKQ